MTTPEADLAAVVAAAFAAAHPGKPSAESVRDLAHRIETALRTAARMEREACADVCARRAELWTSTGDRAATPASLRAEARTRANEALYLADAMRARGTVRQR